MDKKTESALVVGWCSLVVSILIMALSIFFMASGRENGMALLVVGLCLLTVGITTVAGAKKAR